MKTFISAVTILVVLATQAFAIDYDFIDPGDAYYINDWGSENRLVVVVRKLGAGSVKVQDASTGATSTVQASQLLTLEQLRAEELQNTVGGAAVGAAILFCIFSPDDCKSDQ